MKKGRGSPCFIFLFTLLASCTPHMTEKQVTAYTNAKKQYFDGNLDKALEVVSTESFSARQGHQAILLKAKILFLQGNTESAQQVFSELTKEHQDYTEAQIWLARTFLAQGKLDYAESILVQALEFNPEDPRLLSLMGNLWELRSDYQKAVEFYSCAALYADDLARTEISLAQIYYRFGQDTQALSHLRRAQTLISENSLLYRPLQEVEKQMTGGNRNDQ